MQRRYIRTIIIFLLVVLFSYTAMSKVAGFSFFRDQLSVYPLLRVSPSFAAVAIPVSELVVAGLLVYPPTWQAALKAAFVLLLLFTIYLISMLLTEPDLPCSCGGVISQMSWGEHVFFNLGCMGLCVVAARGTGNKEQGTRNRE